MESRDFDKLDGLIRVKNYEALSVEERIFVSGQLGGEQAFTNLRSLVLEAQQSESLLVTSSVKADLVKQFKGKHQKTSFVWLGYRMPAYAQALLLIFVIVSVWFLKPTEQVIIDRAVTVQLPGKTDTLMIQLPADTVFIEKRIRVEVPVYITKTEADVKDSPEVIKGSSLSDQQGLRDLLVSGK
jgi:hypothetical protein